MISEIWVNYISDAFQERYNALKAEPYADPEDRDEYSAAQSRKVTKQLCATCCASPRVACIDRIHRRRRDVCATRRSKPIAGTNGGPTSRSAVHLPVRMAFLAALQSPTSAA